MWARSLSKLPRRSGFVSAALALVLFGYDVARAENCDLPSGHPALFDVRQCQMGASVSCGKALQRELPRVCAELLSAKQTELERRDANIRSSPILPPNAAEEYFRDVERCRAGNRPACNWALASPKVKWDDREELESRRDGLVIPVAPPKFSRVDREPPLSGAPSPLLTSPESSRPSPYDSSSWGTAQRRVAFVVGNSAYQHTGKLANPTNDASDLADVLRAYGFRVIEGYDLNKAAMEIRLREFARALSANEVGLFFYAGHGLQVSGVNYLVPVDARLEDASGLDFELIRLELVQRTMEREVGTNIIFLDACRDNPLARNLARTMGTRSIEIGRGLAPTQGGAGTLISFSTQPGNVALDGSGRNSPFAGSLVRRLIAAKDDLSAILIDVRNDVMKATQDRQVPWEHSALRGRFYFTLASLGVSAPQFVDPVVASAARDYELATKVSTKEAWDAFLVTHPTGFHAEMARVQRAKLGVVATLPKVIPSDKAPSDQPSVKSRTSRLTDPFCAESGRAEFRRNTAIMKAAGPNYFQGKSGAQIAAENLAQYRRQCGRDP